MFERLSDLVSQDIPTFFYTDFKGEKCHCYTLDELKNEDIEFSFHSPAPTNNQPHKPYIDPISYHTYEEKFKKIVEHLKSGNTYLINLTQPTKIKTPLSLREIYESAHAPYKIRVNNSFVCFSPEPFVIIEKNIIKTYPMKGTIDASVPNAIETIMNDHKEQAEHTMVVDLLRNDLGMVAKDIRVKKYRYATAIDTGGKKLYQISSQIEGKLDHNWKKNIGKIFKKILPAGSISGTPKKKSVEIIEEVEEYQRGYFTGVFGFYDGEKLESAVMIRFIENENGNLIYKSGGGITSDSDPEKEYQEMLDKVYIP